MSSYNEQRQALATDYQFATGSVTYTLKDVGVWAMKEGKWEAGRDILLRKFCDDMGRALREEYIRDPQGTPRSREPCHSRRRRNRVSMGGNQYRATRTHGDRTRPASGSDRFRRRPTEAGYRQHNENQNSGGAPVQLRLDSHATLSNTNLLGRRRASQAMFAF